jgi:sortase (surface protein transpeptidase)
VAPADVAGEAPFPHPCSSDLATAEPLGRRRFLAGVGATIGAGALAVSLPGTASAAVPSGACQFVPLERQTRFADTRHPGLYPFTRISPTRISVQITGREGIPATAAAVVVTLTSINKEEYNFVTAYPGKTAVPVASNLNMLEFDEVAANLATVQLGADGTIELDAFDVCEMIVDVAGYYIPVDKAVRDGRFVALPSAVRVHDTRNSSKVEAGEVVIVDVTAHVPADATSVAVNLTADQTNGWLFFTCFPLDTDIVPESSNLNINGPGETRAGAAIVKVTTVDGTRGFKIWTYAGSHVIVDLAGYFTGPTSPLDESGLFVPMSPQRILDTREEGSIGKLWPDWMVEAEVPEPARSGAQAIVGNLTAVAAREPGFFTALGAGTALESVSNLNADSNGETIPNHIITRISTNGIAVYSSHGAHVLIDMAGYFTGVPAFPTHKYINPPPPAVGPPWRLDVPAFNHGSWVYAGPSANPIVNAGNTWHWTGTGYMGQEAHVGVFAHRTEHGGIFRNMHWCQPGDDMFITTSDGRKFQYRIVRKDLTNEVPGNILGATRLAPGTAEYPNTTLSLIGCSRTNQLPTDIRFRLIITGELVKWWDVDDWF